MKVLIACEYSGIVREAFKAKGHDAWSCDLLPTEIPGNHLQGDIFKWLYANKEDGSSFWDMLIGHPPCRFISYAGTSSWNNPRRVFKRLEALNFFAKLWEAPIEKICLENPKGCASPTIAKYSQIIQPYYFGDSDLKTTCLWLKNLPLLKHQKIDSLFEMATHTKRPEPIRIDDTERSKKRYFTDNLRNQKLRSKTFPGIAHAMAEQWG